MMSQEPISKLVSVYAGAEKGAGKQRLDQLELVAAHGVKGDSHAGVKEHRQVSLFENEVLQMVNAEGLDVSAEELSANLFTENLPLESLHPGSRLRVGAALIEITEARKPCGSLTKIDKRLPKRLYRNLGVFARILESGIVRPGDAIEILSVAHP